MKILLHLFCFFLTLSAFAENDKKTDSPIQSDCQKFSREGSYPNCRKVGVPAKGMALKVRQACASYSEFLRDVKVVENSHEAVRETTAGGIVLHGLATKRSEEFYVKVEKAGKTYQQLLSEVKEIETSREKAEKLIFELAEKEKKPSEVKEQSFKQCNVEMMQAKDVSNYLRLGAEAEKNLLDKIFLGPGETSLY